MNMIFKPGPVFDPRLHKIVRTNIVDRATNQIVEPLVPAGNQSFAGLNLPGGIGSAVQIVNLGVSVATFAQVRKMFGQMERSFDQLGQDLAILASKLDARHQAAASAEIAGALEVLTVADTMAPQERRAFVLANFAPLIRACRVYRAFLDEMIADCDNALEARIPLLTLEYGLTIVETRIYAVIERPDECIERAKAFSKAVEQVLEAAITEGWQDKSLEDAKGARGEEQNLREVLEIWSELRRVDALDLLIEHELNPSAVRPSLRRVGQVSPVRVLPSLLDAKRRADGLSLELSASTEGVMLESILTDDDRGAGSIYVIAAA